MGKTKALKILTGIIIIFYVTNHVNELFVLEKKNEEPRTQININAEELPEATESLNGKDLSQKEKYNSLDLLYNLVGKTYKEQSVKPNIKNKELIELVNSSDTINCYMFSAYVGKVLKDNDIPFYVTEVYSPPHVYLLLEKENSNKSVIDIRNYVIGEDKKLTKDGIDEIIKLIQE